MTEENNSNNGKFKALGLVLSIVLHLVLGIAIVFISGDVPKPDEKQIVSINLQPEQPVAVPFVPEPAPSKPDPPKPDPPKPDPPKPDPPKPKQQQPKQQQPKTQSIEDRVKNAPTVKSNSKPKTNRNRKVIEELLGNTTDQPSDNPPASRPLPSGGTVAEVTNYAEQVVKPYILQNWIQPVAGELDVSSVRPVTIGFTVYSGGSVQNARIVKLSNSKVLNDSVRNFLAQMTRLPALSSKGIKSSKLEITVDVCLTH